MRSRINLILLGVADIERASAFYCELGWKKGATSHAGFAKFDLGGLVIGLLDRAQLASDAMCAEIASSGFPGFALAYIAHHPDEVATVLARAVQLGGTLVKPATTTAWGVAGYFRDLDGHLFEVLYEDGWVFDASDNLIV